MRLSAMSTVPKNMDELNKLEQYLKEKKIPYNREKMFPELSAEYGERINVYNKKGKRLWDAVCGLGTYGGEEGLLEAAGQIVTGKIVTGNKYYHEVEGSLTAEEIIRRIEEGKEEKG